uniref:M04/gp34 protein n=1 Tax=Murid herpesvirus 1 TaxID=10366 RepID=A3QZZ6_MUHV1|nr:m04/gp34 protein [Murid betaherpesvirus 1]
MSPVYRLVLISVLMSNIFSSADANANDCQEMEKKYKEKMKYRRPLGCYFKSITPTQTSSSSSERILKCTLPSVKVNASWSVEWVVVSLDSSLDVVSYYESSPTSEPKFLYTTWNYTPLDYKKKLLTIDNGFKVDNSSNSENRGNLYVYSNATDHAGSVKCRLKMCPWTSDSSMNTPDKDLLTKMQNVLTLPDYIAPIADPGPKYDYYAKKTPPADMTVTTLTVIVTLLYVVAFCLLAYVFGPSLYRRFFSSDCCSNFKPLKNN